MAGIKEITVVVGYCADAIRAALGGRARMVLNPQWQSTNSLFSLSLCRYLAGTPLLIMNCDVLVHPVAVQRLLSLGGNAFLYDSSSGNSEEHMKVELADGALRAMSKSLPSERTHGENVGMLYFGAAASRVLFREAERLLGKGNRNQWAAAVVERVAKISSLHGIDIADLPWIEIDFPSDLRRACTQVWQQVSFAMVPAMRLAS
jgi:L-glutamine-phosphate cytidylyltransferase